MFKLKRKSLIMKYFIQIALCFLISIQILNAQLACNSLVNISLDLDGEATVNADVFLEGNTCSTCEITVTDAAGNSLGSGVDFTFDCTMINRYLSYQVDDLQTGNSCWGQVYVEDKLDACDFGGPAAVINGLCGIGDYDLLLNGTDILTQQSDCIRLFPALNNGANTLSFSHNPIDGLNGVSTLDLVLMRNGIIDGFNSPIDAILSDIDSDGVLSTTDLVNTRKSVLGATTGIDLGQLRIFDANDPFTGFNPFGFTNNYESLDFDSDYFNDNNNLLVVVRKLADINNTAIDNFTDPVLEDRSEKVLSYNNIELIAGENYTIDFSLDHAGLQALTSGIVIEGAEILSVTAPAHEESLIAFFEGDKAGLSFLGMEVDELSFSIEFTAYSNVLLSDIIDLDEYVPNDLVDHNMEEFEIVLEATTLTNTVNPSEEIATKVFPNPTSNEATIIFSNKFEGVDKSIQIFNSSGNRVFETTTNQQQYQINNQMKLMSGFYIIEIRSSNDHSRLKLIIE